MHGLDCVFNHLRFSAWSSSGQYTIFSPDLMYRSILYPKHQRVCKF